MSKSDKTAELPERIVLLLAELDRIQKDAHELSERVRAKVEEAYRIDAENAPPSEKRRKRH